jgi:NAD(P)-dependent dehydrogenase (short-subunit alcohol dehydrogenase family)
MTMQQEAVGRLEGKRALVTGASRGIGRVVAQSFVGAGASVALVARRPELLEEVVSELRQVGGEVFGVSADCSIADDTQRAVEQAHAALGGLDVVVNVAGIHPEWGRVGEHPIDSWDRTIQTNLSGCFYVCRYALPFLVENGAGSIISISSVSAQRGWQLYAPYNVAKAGIESLTKTMAVEYAKDGVRANCVIPGVINAGMTFDIIEREPEQREQLSAMNPMGRLGSAEEVAEAVVWLASDASSYTTGVSLAVDGGFLA